MLSCRFTILGSGGSCSLPNLRHEFSCCFFSRIFVCDYYCSFWFIFGTGVFCSSCYYYSYCILNRNIAGSDQQNMFMSNTTKSVHVQHQALFNVHLWDSVSVVWFADVSVLARKQHVCEPQNNVFLIRLYVVSTRISFSFHIEAE